MGIGNWKIGTRLAGGLGLSLVFMVGMSVVGIGNLGKLNDGTGDLAADKVPKVIEAYEAVGGVNDIARAMRNAMLSTDCLLYTSPSPRDLSTSRMPSSA